MDKNCFNFTKEPLQYGNASKKKDSFFRLKSEFNFVKENSSKFVSQNLIILYTEPENEKLKIGIICGRKFSNKAVIRNRVRRIIKEAFRLLWNQITPTRILIIPRKGSELLKTQDIQRELVSAFKKLHLWKDAQNTKG